jgi:hypothetical protein
MSHGCRCVAAVIEVPLAAFLQAECVPLPPPPPVHAGESVFDMERSDLDAKYSPVKAGDAQVGAFSSSFSMYGGARGCTHWVRAVLFVLLFWCNLLCGTMTEFGCCCHTG